MLLDDAHEDLRVRVGDDAPRAVAAVLDHESLAAAPDLEILEILAELIEIEAHGQDAGQAAVGIADGRGVAHPWNIRDALGPQQDIGFRPGRPSCFPGGNMPGPEARIVAVLVRAEIKGLAGIVGGPVIAELQLVRLAVSPQFPNVQLAVGQAPDGEPLAVRLHAQRKGSEVRVGPHDFQEISGRFGEVADRQLPRVEQPDVQGRLVPGGEQHVVDLLIDPQGRLREDLGGEVVRREVGVAERVVAQGQHGDDDQAGEDHQHGDAEGELHRQHAPGKWFPNGEPRGVSPRVTWSSRLLDVTRGLTPLGSP